MLWRSKWKEELELSNAAHFLRSGSIDSFPLSQVQAITNTHILTSSRGTLIQPCSPAADEAILAELHPLKGRLRLYESGLLATLHALSPYEARWRVSDLVPDPASVDEHFDDRVAIYLQFLILARKARDLACDEIESRAAMELLVLLNRAQRDHFAKMPTIWGTLQASAKGRADVLLPLPLIETILRRCSYARYFQDEVRHLQASYEWSELHKLVAGAADLIDFPNVVSLVLPPTEFSSLLIWKPDTRRIDLWASKNQIIRRYKVDPILKLEGPDITGNQGHTLRHSDAGDYVSLAGVPRHEGISILEALLEAFDHAVASNPTSIQAVASTCCDQPHLKTYHMLSEAVNSWRSLPHPRSQLLPAELSIESRQPEPSSHNTSPSSAAIKRWLDRPLDPERATLRNKLQHELKNVPLSLIKTCIEQSLKPHCQDEFIRQLNDLLMDDNDQVCVNVANFLGPRCDIESNQIDGCWTRLLMHMMRQQPEGMMDRCGEKLLWETWSSWVTNLSILYGEEHFSPTKGLGFTREGFDRWTQQKKKPSRSVSSRTVPTARMVRRAPGMQSLRSHRDARLTHRSVSTPSDGDGLAFARSLRPDDSPSSRS